jgi:hypothetical protein
MEGEQDGMKSWKNMGFETPERTQTEVAQLKLKGAELALSEGEIVQKIFRAGPILRLDAGQFGIMGGCEGYGGFAQSLDGLDLRMKGPFGGRIGHGNLLLLGRLSWKVNVSWVKTDLPGSFRKQRSCFV